MNEQDEKRIRFDLVMPLTGESHTAIPEFLESCYQEIEKQGSAIKEIPLVTEIENVALQSYATDQSGPLQFEFGALGSMQLADCTLRNFKLTRITRDKKEIVALAFSVTTKSTVGLVVWAFQFHGKTFWSQFAIEPGGKPLAQIMLDEQKQATLPIAAAPASTLPGCSFPDCTLEFGHEGDHNVVPKDNTPDKFLKGRGRKSTPAMQLV